MTLQELNELPLPRLKDELRRCCASTRWINSMSAVFPFEREEDLYREAELIWFDCDEDDWKEAFSHHPKIGDLQSLKEKYADTHQWIEGELAGVNYTTPQVLEALAAINTEYEQKFGYIFVVCGSGMSAEEMLSMLTLRILNSPEDEIKIAMEEQHKITVERLSKLLS